METNNKTIEVQKQEVEEKKIGNTVLDTTKVLASEENKSETIITSKNNTDSKQNTKNESNDSEDIGFEIITPEPAEKKENVITESDTATTEVESKQTPEDTNVKEEPSKQADTKKSENPVVDASLIDIKIIKEEDDGSNKDSPESDAQGTKELELALKEIPDLPSSTSKEILAQANNEDDKNIVDEIETKAEEKPGGTLIDITVIEETNKEKNVQEVIEEAEHSFEAEVIDDNEDIKVVPSDDEDVIEYTLETRHILPFLTILVAFVAVFAGLIFYYN